MKADGRLARCPLKGTLAMPSSPCSAPAATTSARPLPISGRFGRSLSRCLSASERRNRARKQPDHFVQTGLLTDLGADGAGVLAIAGQDLAALLRPRGGALAPACAHRLRDGRAAEPRPAGGGAGRERDHRCRGAPGDADARWRAGHRRCHPRPSRETVRLVIDRGGDYLFALKANRPAILREVAAFFADPP